MLKVRTIPEQWRFAAWRDRGPLPTIGTSQSTRSVKGFSVSHELVASGTPGKMSMKNNETKKYHSEITLFGINRWTLPRKISDRCIQKIDATRWNWYNIETDIIFRRKVIILALFELPFSTNISDGNDLTGYGDLYLRKRGNREFNSFQGW